MLATLSAKHELSLAALDIESEVDEVDFTGGIEEFKRRLEILLGAKPEASQDERSAEVEAGRLARQDRVAAAGGQLLAAAFGFPGEMLPVAEDSAEVGKVAAVLRAQLAACLQTDATGRPQLTVTLPDAGALDRLAVDLGRLLLAAPAGGSAAAPN